MGIKVDSIHLRDLAAKSIGPFESELTFETDDGKPMSIDIPCKKNPGHPSFIPVAKFKPENIPELHRTKRFYETILAWANLVVRVVVKRISRNRPEVYSDTKVTFPDSDNRLRGTTRKVRYGSGYVVSGFGSNQPYRGQFCPCHLCRDNGQRREFWSLNIATVTHVIYDSSEARDSVFEFFYDSEDKKGVDFMYGTDSFEQVGKNTEKICIVRCVTHNRDLFKRLLNILTRCQSMAISKEEPKFENHPVVLISHPHGKCKCITIGGIASFIVPFGTDFPVSRPIMFTRTSECRLPLMPWSQKPNSNNDARCEGTTQMEVKKTKCQNQNINNSEPMPAPIKYPSDTETYLEANGFFVINTGKTQNILSPGMFKRESENPLSIEPDSGIQNLGAASHKTNEFESASGTKGNCESNVEDILEYFYDGCNFHCVNVDNDSVFMPENIYFGSPAPSRDMQLRGLTKHPNSLDPDVPIQMDVQNVMNMYQRVNEHEGSDSDLSTKHEIMCDPAHPSQAQCITNTDPRDSNLESESKNIKISNQELNENDVSTESHLTCSAMGDGTDAVDCIKEIDKGPSGARNFNKEGVLFPREKENTQKGKISCKDRDGFGGNDSEDELSSETGISYSVQSSLPCVVNPEDINTDNATSKDERQRGYETGSLAHKDDKDTKEVEPIGILSRNDSSSVAEADLSIPEMLQILIDKGIDLFPESDNENASGVDMLNELINALCCGDGLPLVSTLNKIYEDVATKSIKPLTLDPGTQFNLPEGTTFTLPENAKFALRFHDLTTSWFSFPPGTTFHNPEGLQLDIPHDAEFSFRCQSVVQGFMTYKLDSCPGSSGGLVVLGKGMWNSGHIAHSGQFDDQTHENRSSLRRWMIYIN